MVFDLSAREGFYQAIARKRSRRGLSVSVDLATGSDRSPISQRALSLLLLKASHCVRGVRAAVETHAGASEIRFETVYPTQPALIEFEHTLAALAVACDLCGAETAALQDEAIAESYLRFQGSAVRSHRLGVESGEIRKSVVAA